MEAIALSLQDKTREKKNQFCLTILILVVKGNFLSVTKYCRWKMFSSHTAGSLGIGHVTEGRAVAFVASAITDLPTHLP